MNNRDNRVRLEASFVVLVGLLGEETCDTFVSQTIDVLFVKNDDLVCFVALVGDETCDISGLRTTGT